MCGCVQAGDTDVAVELLVRGTPLMVPVAAGGCTLLHTTMNTRHPDLDAKRYGESA